MNVSIVPKILKLFVLTGQSNSLGTLDPQGRASVTFQLPAGLSPGLAGAVVHHAALVLGPTQAVVRTTNAVPVELAP